ncbi:MAG: SUMF1/EgtB/PvdO family nonheme iron enzyme [Lentisphaerae bacterium]|nr:SUMF1/EgtB/PvdO family nonheme iron enzyme [Lentisphaerota bacterium]
MLFVFQCPACQASIETAADVSGRQSQCPQCQRPLVVPEARVDCGATLGDFRLERRLGKGGMGEVFLGTQLSVDRQVAVKVLPPAFAENRDAVARFLHEGRLAARLDHHHIVTVHAAGEDCGHYYLAMAYVDGESLDQRLRRDGVVPEPEALAIVRTIADALCYAWDEFKLLHRDLKPANIMVDRRGRVFLMDLGLAKSLGEDTGMTLSGAILGTPQYMSPEQAMGSSQLSVQTDVYSLGATLYHLVVGAPPFTGESALKVLSQHVHAPWPPPRSRNPQVSEACSALIGAMMAKAPGDRYAGWRELIADIDRVLAGAAPAAPSGAASSGAVEAGATRTAGLTPQALALLVRHHQAEAPPTPAAACPSADGSLPPARRPRVGRRQWLAAAAAAAALLIALGGALARRGRGDAAPPASRAGYSGGGPMGQAGPPAPAAPARLVEVAGQRVRVPGDFHAAPDTAPEPYTGTGWAREVVHTATGIAMVYVPAGSFTMGSPTAEAGRDSDERQHGVTLTRGFYLGKFEVTQAQWQSVMGRNPSQFTGAGADAPAEMVSWDDCQAFCRTLGEGFRLPTEAEWEYACRAGTTTAIYTGPLTIVDTNNGMELDAIAWYGGNSRVTYEGGFDSSAWPGKQHRHDRAGTHPVGKKQPNAWGLYDMLGNVWEWCQDGYGDYPSEAVTDPAGSGTGSDRVFRGGSWNRNAKYCRVANRDWNPPSNRLINVGCRLVRSVP